MKSNRHLAAILFTDLSHPRPDIDTSEKQFIQVRKQYHSTLITYHVMFKGKIVNFFGNGSVSLFRCTLDALRCARAMQQQFQALENVGVRMGLHVGEVLNEQEDISGASVNLAARIKDLSLPGSILFSDFAYAQIRNQPEFQVMSLGRFSMKNISGKLHTYALNDNALVVPSRSDILKHVPRYQIRSWLQGVIQVLLLLVRPMLTHIS